MCVGDCEGIYGVCQRGQTLTSDETRIYMACGRQPRAVQGEHDSWRAAVEERKLYNVSCQFPQQATCQSLGSWAIPGIDWAG